VKTTTVRFPTARGRFSRSSQETVSLVGTLYLPSRLATASVSRPAAARGPVPGLLVGHGAGSHRGRHDGFCRTACDAGFVVLAFDFRGHGQSEGVADGPLESDILAAARFLRNTGTVDPGLIAYRGSSMGGFYGLRAAPEAALAALVLLCPASRTVLLDAVLKAEESGPAREGDLAAPGDQGRDRRSEPEARWDLPRMRRYLERTEEWDATAQVSCPVLIVHARGDEVVPLDHSLALAQRFPGEVTLTILPGGHHTSAQHDRDVHRQVVHWLRRQLLQFP